MGITNVTVVEIDQVDVGPFRRLASMLSLQFGHVPLLACIAQYSYQRYIGFEGEPTIDFRKIGWISIALEPTADELQ